MAVMDDLVWRGQDEASADAPVTLTGMMQDYASIPPAQGTSLGLLMNNQEQADAGISPLDQSGDGNVQVAANGRAYDGLCRLPDGSVHPYTDIGGGFGAVYGGGNPDSNGQAGVGEAANGTAMPTVPKPGGVAGGGASGPVTSPASGAARDLTGGTRAGILKPVTGTSSLGGSIGKAIPFLGVPLMMYDFYQHQTAPDCVPIPDPTAIY